MGDLTSTPRIWFEQSAIHQENGGDCNCNCACPVQPSVPNLGEDQRNFQRLRTGLYCQAPSLYLQECYENYWLVCNPMRTGRITVLDRSAMSLFRLFQTPTVLVQVMHKISEWPPEIVYATVVQFARLGLLEDLSASVSGHCWSESRTLTAWLHITNDCNLRCSYCYLQKSHKGMSAETGRRAVDAIFRSAIKHGFDRIRLKYAGGEASLHMQQVLSVHDYASTLAQKQSIGLDAVILSNGVALSKQMIDELVTRHVKVMISLDGIGDYHDSQRPFVNGQGSFHHVERTIDRLLARELHPYISITVSNRNLDGLPELIQYVLARRLLFSLNYYRENECSASMSDLPYEEERVFEVMHRILAVIERDLPQHSLVGCLTDQVYLGEPHRHYCEVGRNYLVIDQDGGVAKCQMDIRRTVTTIADEDPLQSVWDDREGIQNLSVDQKDGCQTCQWRYWCAGGCALLAYRATGQYESRSPNCNIYNKLYPEVLRVEAIRLLGCETPWVPHIVNR